MLLLLGILSRYCFAHNITPSSMLTVRHRNHFGNENLTILSKQLLQSPLTVCLPANHTALLLKQNDVVPCPWVYGLFPQNISHVTTPITQINNAGPRVCGTTSCGDVSKTARSSNRVFLYFTRERRSKVTTDHDIG